MHKAINIIQKIISWCPRQEKFLVPKAGEIPGAQGRRNSSCPAHGNLSGHPRAGEYLLFHQYIYEIQITHL
jgi:hypothetical protein